MNNTISTQLNINQNSQPFEDLLLAPGIWIPNTQTIPVFVFWNSNYCNHVLDLSCSSPCNNADDDFAILINGVYIGTAVLSANTANIFIGSTNQTLKPGNLSWGSLTGANIKYFNPVIMLTGSAPNMLDMMAVRPNNCNNFGNAYLEEYYVNNSNPTQILARKTLETFMYVGPTGEHFHFMFNVYNDGTPNVTPTPTKTRSLTATPIVTPTPTKTRSLTATPIVTPTPTKTRSLTATPSVTPTSTPGSNPNPSSTPTQTQTPTQTKTRSAISVTPTPTKTRSLASVTPSPTPTKTQTPTQTKTRSAISVTPTPTKTRSAISVTPTPTKTRSPGIAPGGEGFNGRVTTLQLNVSTQATLYFPFEEDFFVINTIPGQQYSVDVTGTRSPMFVPQVGVWISGILIENDYEHFHKIFYAFTPTTYFSVRQVLPYGVYTGSYTIRVQQLSTPSVTPTPTKTRSLTATPSVTPSRTPNVTPSRTPNVTPNVTPSRTPNVTPNVTPSRTPNVTKTRSAISVTPTPTKTRSLVSVPSAEVGGPTPLKSMIEQELQTYIQTLHDHEQKHNP